MDDQQLANLRWLTDAKLRYAILHYEELSEAGKGGSDFERAHLESCLFHLIGARDAFLHELVAYYAIEKPDRISLGSVRAALSAAGKKSPELAELYSIERDDNPGWFNDLKKFRDHIAHKGPARHHFKLHVNSGITSEPEIELPWVDGKPVTLMARYARNILAIWHAEMEGF